MTKYTLKTLFATLALCGVVCQHSLTAQDNEALIRSLCGQKLLPDYYCSKNKEKTTVIDIIKWMTEHASDNMQSDTEEELYDDISDVYDASIRYWVKHDTADFYNKPPHPDSLRVQQQKSQAMIETLLQYKLINASQANEIEQAIRNNRVIYPVSALTMANVLLVEEMLETSASSSLLTDSLKTVFPSLMHSQKGIFDDLAAVPEYFALNFSEPLLKPETGLQALTQLLRAMHPDVKQKMNWRLSTEGFQSMCSIPILRYEVVYGLPVNTRRECTFELSASKVKDKPMVPASAFTKTDGLPNFLLQLEQNKNSTYTALLVLNKVQWRNLLLEQLALPQLETAFVAKNAGKSGFIRLTAPQYERLRQLKIPFGDSRGIAFPESMLYHRATTGLSSRDKERIWDKMQNCGLMDRFPAGAQDYLWSNLSSYQMKDSIEMLRQMFLLDYPDLYASLHNVNTLFAKPIRNLGQLVMLSTLSRGDLKTSDYSGITLTEIEQLTSYWFEFSCKKQPKKFKVYMVGERLDLAVLSVLATAWREVNPGSRCFYYINETRAILYLSETEAEKFSSTMNLLLKQL